MVALTYDEVAGAVTLRVDGGAFNIGDGDEGWGQGDFVLVFAMVTNFEIQDAGPSGGELLRFEAGDECYRLETTGGVATWGSAAPVMSWYLPRWSGRGR